MPVAPLIFVVDDDAVTLELIQIGLEADGMAVRTFGSVAAVLPALARETPALLLLDVRMPGQSGLDGLKAVKESLDGAGLPVLMLTGDGRLDRIVQAMQLGAAGYVMKPFSAQQLAAKVRETLAV
ncbi:response regulator [Caulobacter sp. DWR2-3-1b2]|uniref:response regulator n=1 Tax=unclassified Caulobacter TaxID=2648921 RepID=UPI0019C0FDAE|nr:response regulator [Caulobacter sp.]